MIQFGTYFNKPQTQSSDIVEALSIFNAATIPSPIVSNGCIRFGNTDRILNSLISIPSVKNIRCGSLIWYPYPFTYSSNIKDVEEVVFNYITSTVTRYPTIQYWDVLNEAFLESGRLRTTCSKGKVNSISKIPNWIQKIFTWAHTANPNTQLFINEYRPQNSLKWDGVFKLVDNLLEQGVPIHGIGIQHHHHLPRCVADGIFAWGATRSICRKAQQRGLVVHFTETSVWNNPRNFHLQALAYKQLAQCAVDEGVKHFNIWSPFDIKEWHWGFKPEDKEAGIYNADLQPKPAYYALKGLVF